MLPRFHAMSRVPTFWLLSGLCSCIEKESLTGCSHTAAVKPLLSLLMMRKHFPLGSLPGTQTPEEPRFSFLGENCPLDPEIKLGGAACLCLVTGFAEGKQRRKVGMQPSILSLSMDFVLVPFS